MEGMEKSETLEFTYSGLLNRKGKKVVSVRFERAGGRDFADGILPDCAIEKQQGFSDDEVEQLEVYLMEHADELMAKAKEMSKLTNLL